MAQAQANSRTNRSRNMRRSGIALILVILVLPFLLTGLAAAQSGGDSCGDDDAECQKDKLEEKFNQVGDLIIFIVVAVALPNGAFGFLQWMTADDNVDQDNRGRRRIRNTFIALGGVAVLKILIEFFKVALL